MNQLLTRRELGKLALGATAVAGFSYLANKTLAQTPRLVIYGVQRGKTISPDYTPSDQGEIEISSTNPASIATSNPVELIVQSFDVGSGRIETLTVPQFLGDGTPILFSNEEINGFTTLANGTLVLTVTPVSGSKKEADPSRIIVLGTSPTAVTISGLKKENKLGSLVGTSDGGLLGIVLKRNGRPPVRLVDIDLQTGEIIDKNRVQLPQNQRFISLAQCLDGSIYTVTVADNGTSNLVKLDQEQKKPIILEKLSLRDGVLNNGLQSLVCSSAGQLLALGAPRYKTPNNLYTIDANTGAATLLKPFDVAMVTINRS